MNLKKFMSLYVLLLLFSCIIFTGCTNKEDKASKEVAEKFIKAFYSVNKSKINEYNEFINNVDLTKLAQLNLKLHNELRSLSTNDEYKRTIANSSYIHNLQYCEKNNCTIETASIILKQVSYDKKSNKIYYDYKAKLKVTDISNNKSRVCEESGTVGLSKEESVWRICGYKNSFNLIQ